MSNLQAWQIPLFVTLAIVVLVGLEWLVARVVQTDAESMLRGRRVRTVALGVLALLTVAVFVVALGPSLADELSSVAAGVATLVALWLTFRSVPDKTPQEKPDEKPTEG